VSGGSGGDDKSKSKSNQVGGFNQVKTPFKNKIKSTTNEKAVLTPTGGGAAESADQSKEKTTPSAQAGRRPVSPFTSVTSPVLLMDQNEDDRNDTHDDHIDENGGGGGGGQCNAILHTSDVLPVSSPYLDKNHSLEFEMIDFMDDEQQDGGDLAAALIGINVAPDKDVYSLDDDGDGSSDDDASSDMDFKGVQKNCKLRDTHLYILIYSMSKKLLQVAYESVCVLL
jgi:hypothetical protein